MKATDADLLFHLLCEPRYGANCTFAVAHGGVATPWNRTTIPRRCVSPKAPAFGALHYRKRTLHPVQLRILG